MDKQISSTYRELLTAEAIAAAGTVTTDVIDLTQSSGKIKIQSTITGSGTLKLELLESLDGITWIENATDIVTGLTAGSALTARDCGVSCYIKIKATETGEAEAVALTLGVTAQ
jgi:hypothetical protein